jgi:argininosuccinate lyase
MELRAESMAELAGANFATATELANWLVSERGLPFRKCHEIVGSLVKRLIDEKRPLGDAQRVAEALGELGVEAHSAELGFLGPLECLERQRSLGSTGPRETKRMHRALAKQLAAHQKAAAQRRERIAEARARTAAAVKRVLRGGSLAKLDL